MLKRHWKRREDCAFRWGGWEAPPDEVVWISNAGFHTGWIMSLFLVQCLVYSLFCVNFRWINAWMSRAWILKRLIWMHMWIVSIFSYEINELWQFPEQDWNYITIALNLRSTRGMRATVCSNTTPSSGGPEQLAALFAHCCPLVMVQNIHSSTFVYFPGKIGQWACTISTGVLGLNCQW